MAKRVSLKGKGADIFFGDYAPSDQSPSVAPTQESGDASPLDQPASSDASMIARTRASKNARRQEINIEGISSNTPNGVVPQSSVAPVSPAAEETAAAVLDSIWRQVAEPATITNSFRYTEREMWSLTEAIFDIAKQHGVKLSKQDIARLGLNYVLRDYQARGGESLLGKFVSRRKHQSGAGL